MFTRNRQMARWLLLCGCAFLLVGCASGQSGHVSRNPTDQIASGKSLDGDYNVESQAFPRIKAALDALSRSYHRRSIRENREYVAAILEDNGVYRVTVQAGRSGRNRVRMKLRRKKSQTLVAVWHTHGAPGRRREVFSATDSRTVTTTGVPMYLTTPLGKLKVLGKRENGCAVFPGVNIGTIIGHI